MNGKNEGENIYDAIAERIALIRNTKMDKIWVRISGYHGGGKTYIVGDVDKKLKTLGIDSVVVGLDISWISREDRNRWREEGYHAREKGEWHPYFNGLTHWRKEHSDGIISALESGRGEIIVENCYNLSSGTSNNRCSFNISDDSTILVDSVYAEALNKKNWDLKIHVISNHEHAKHRAIVRGEKRAYRAPSDTMALYDEVYEPTYAKYVERFQPEKDADILIDTSNIDNPTIIKVRRLTSPAVRL